MTHSYYLRKVFIVGFLCMFGLFQASAQNSDDAKEVTSTYYIKNAFVVQSPGNTLPGTSVLIKDGLIHAVGKNVAIPFDAKVE